MSQARDLLRERLTTALAGERAVLAVWEQGSAAFGRDDAESDLDLSVVVQDGSVAAATSILEATLAHDYGIELRYELAKPTWHGHWQAFYRLRGVPPTLLVDCVVMERSSTSWFCEPEVHGRKPRIAFDREGLLAARRLDQAAHAATLTRATERLAVTLEIFHPFVEKELRRGRSIDAWHFYQSLVLARLVEALRIRYCPERATFGYRYLDADLPADAAKRLASLVYVASPAELPAKKAEALAWARETLEALRERSHAVALAARIRATMGG